MLWLLTLHIISTSGHVAVSLLATPMFEIHNYTEQVLMKSIYVSCAWKKISANISKY